MLRASLIKSEFLSFPTFALFCFSLQIYFFAAYFPLTLEDASKKRYEERVKIEINGKHLIIGIFGLLIRL